MVGMAVGSGMTGFLAQTRVVRRRLAKLERTVKKMGGELEDTRAEVVELRDTTARRFALVQAAFRRFGRALHVHPQPK